MYKIVKISKIYDDVNLDGNIMKFEKYSLDDLKYFCAENNIDVRGKSKGELIQLAYQKERENIDNSIENGCCYELLKRKIYELSDKYEFDLRGKIDLRKNEMKSDDKSHYLIYRVLGIKLEEGELIDEYQNTGRFLYKYAGAFLEEAATICLFFSNSKGGKTKVNNTEGVKPKTFEIDFLNGNDAIELKWRDATTDGDHITKEHTRVKVIKSHGYNPVRVMFYYPLREQAIKIQEALKAIYLGLGGEYYAGDEAWEYLHKVSGYDLKSILIEIADKKGN
ncbi:ApaLI family restriction endonuclease [Providencia rettgeri]|uniref:ApaLI family restriction endonuclease n=1 Tax=Providencia TaxID=586 RepID=UPI0032D9B473